MSDDERESASVISTTSSLDIISIDLGTEFPANPTTFEEYEKVIREYRRRLAASQHAAQIAKKKRIDLEEYVLCIYYVFVDSQGNTVKVISRLIFKQLHTGDK